MDSAAKRLLRALLSVQGAEVEGDLREDDLAFARLLVAARRRDQEEGGCPDRARRRAHALFASRPVGLWETAARLVFDSWQQLAPAARSLGTERLLRFESGLASADLQVEADPDGAGVTVAVAVEGGGEGLEARIRVEDGPARAIGLDEHGTGSLHVAAPCGALSLQVGDEDGELLQTPVVSLG